MFRRTGMPAFGPIGSFAGSDEPHAGFKVFVVNDDRKGLSWMMVLHQGSGSPRRGTVRFHSLDTWLFRGRRLLAHTRVMADFGHAVGQLPRRPDASPHAAAARPTLQVGLRGVGHAAERGRRVPRRARVRDRQRDHAVRPGGSGACGVQQAVRVRPCTTPRAWDSYCKGDKRTVLRPRWRVSGRGASRFRTDARGRRAAAGLLQVVARRARVDQRRECCGVENAFVMERPSDGGIYRAGRGLNSANFEFPGYCVLRAN